jgi:hypothetical protein
MLLLARDDLRRFRAVFRRCRSTRTPDATSFVRITVTPDSLRLFGATAEAMLGWIRKQALDAESDWCLPASVLDLADTGTIDHFEVQALAKHRVRFRWPQGEQDFDASPVPPPAWPDAPERWGTADGALLTALYEASRTSDRKPIRWSTHRVQIQGAAGRVVATDTRQALLWGGFPFPFSENLLIPALPVFGAKEWRRETGRVGRTATQLVLALGPWMLGFNIDPAGKFPDVASVVPKAQQPTAVTLDEADARFLLDQLPDLPHPDDDNSITLDVGENAAVLRCSGPSEEPPTELRLPRSRVAGPAIRIAFDRQYLHRGLTLGLRTIQLCGPERPIALRDRHRIYLAYGHHPSTAIPRPDEAHVIAPPGKLGSLPPPQSTPEIPMPLPAPRSHSPPEVEAAIDPLAEAEAIRSLLVEAAQRATQLVQLLKAKRKADRAITQVVRSLQALPLNGRM